MCFLQGPYKSNKNLFVLESFIMYANYLIYLNSAQAILG